VGRDAHSHYAMVAAGVPAGLLSSSRSGCARRRPQAALQELMTLMLESEVSNDRQDAGPTEDGVASGLRSSQLEGGANPTRKWHQISGQSAPLLSKRRT
jgi:hypothetical protein